jgi:hypothetical protein
LARSQKSVLEKVDRSADCGFAKAGDMHVTKVAVQLLANMSTGDEACSRHVWDACWPEACHIAAAQYAGPTSAHFPPLCSIEGKESTCFQPHQVECLIYIRAS